MDLVLGAVTREAGTLEDGPSFQFSGRINVVEHSGHVRRAQGDGRCMHTAY